MQAPVTPLNTPSLFSANDTITYRASRDSPVTTARVVAVMGTHMLRVQPLRNGQPEGTTCCISVDGSVNLLTTG